MKQNSGARYEIAVDGKPRSYRDQEAIAMEAGEYIKSKAPHAEVTVRDLATGQTKQVMAVPLRIR